MGAADNWHAEGIFERYAPDVLRDFRASQQQNDSLFPSWLNWLHVPIAALAMAVLPVLVAFGIAGRVAPPSATLAMTVLIALLANAAISGVFSNPNDRYQSRIAWLAPFAVAIAAIGSRRCGREA
jgi:4-amino-4-deoxy-L-arabinose transferase-like glycosyltransferase